MYTIPKHCNNISFLFTDTLLLYYSPICIYVYCPYVGYFLVKNLVCFKDANMHPSRILNKKIGNIYYNERNHNPISDTDIDNKLNLESVQCLGQGIGYVVEW